MRAFLKQFLVVACVASSVAATLAASAAPATATQPNDVPAGAVERTDLRTAASRTFQLPGGKLLTQLFDKRIFYQAVRPHLGSQSIRD